MNFRYRPTQDQPSLHTYSMEYNTMVDGMGGSWGNVGGHIYYILVSARRVDAREKTECSDFPSERGGDRYAPPWQ